MTDPAAEPEGAERAEGTGETVGEAKWAALRELERRFPGLDKAAVRFDVVSEGERGLLGVGYAPARVIATLAGPAPPSPARAAEEPGSPAAQLRELLERICAALGVGANVSIAEAETGLVARLTGPDLGLVIGKRGQTIDAIQYLANVVLWREDEPRREVVVDAAGYRRRRETTLQRTAERAAREALQMGAPVLLEPMTASERKIVHLYLQARPGIATASEGEEPNRRVVVSPTEV
jgi:spoIIIJ-associated protein